MLARSLEGELLEVQKRIDRLVAAIEQGVDAATVTGKLRGLEARKAGLWDEIASSRLVPMPPRHAVETRLVEWRLLLRQNVTTGRAVLDRLVDGRIQFHPVGSGYQFTAATRYDRLLSGIVVPKSVWTAPLHPGVEGIGPEDVYYAGQDDEDYGQILERAVNRMNVASPICASWNQMVGWLRAVDGLRRAA